jgi:hypothetical protein
MNAKSYQIPSVRPELCRRTPRKFFNTLLDKTMSQQQPENIFDEQ